MIKIWLILPRLIQLSDSRVLITHRLPRDAFYTQHCDIGSRPRRCGTSTHRSTPEQSPPGSVAAGHRGWCGPAAPGSDAGRGRRCLRDTTFVSTEPLPVVWHVVARSATWPTRASTMLQIRVASRLHGPPGLLFHPLRPAGPCPAAFLSDSQSAKALE